MATPSDQPQTPTHHHGITPALADRATPISSLQPHPLNARRRGDRAKDELQRSLEINGQYRTVIARRLEGGVLQLLAGHGTVEAAAELGWTHVAADIHEGISDDAAARIVSVDNRTSDLAEYDDSLLAELLGSLPDLAGTGYGDDELARLVAATTSPVGGLTDVDAAPVAPDVPVSRPGDVWVLGPHRLACGDATDGDVWARLLGEERVDCVWTDPPYGVEYEGKTADALTIENDGRDLDELEDLLRESFSRVLERCKPGACWYVAAPAGPATLPFGIVLTELGIWRQTLVWAKDRFVLGHSDYHYRHEVIYLGYGPKEAGIGRRGRGGGGWYGPNNVDTVLEVPRPARADVHPTMKPVDLIVRCLENSAALGQVVADLYGGSGSTLIACHRLGLVARLVELDPRYVDVICRRYQQHTGVVPVLEATGEEHDFTEAAAA